MIPENPEAEKNVLSCIFLDESSLAKCLEWKVDEHHFYDPAYQKIFLTFLWLFRTGKPITIEVVVEQLKAKEKFDQIGMAKLLEASDARPTVLEFTFWLEKLRDAYIRRKLWVVSTEMREKVQKGDGTPEDYLAAVHQILSIQQSGKTQKSIWQAALDTLSKCERLDAGQPSLEDMGLAWPWPDWNRRFGTCKRTELAIIAARPSRGKSSAGRQIALHWAKNYGPTLYFSREMSVDEVAPLFAQTLSRKSWKSYETLSHADRLDFKSALKQVEDLGRGKLHLIEQDRTINQVVARIRSFSTASQSIRGIVIDYLQRYDPQQEKGETRDIALGRLTCALKDIALELKVPVILLAQLSRGVERESREPRLSDLRESGNIEQDSDRVIFLDWPSVKPDGATQDILDGSINHIFVNAIQAKGRGEGCDRSEMIFERSIATFSSPA